jgi:glycosyltransferase involved in cell wall biosynthesis
MKSVDIILPVYNEEEGLVAFHRTLSGVLDGLAGAYQFNIIYVLDRSRDDSFSVLRTLALQHSNVTVLHLSRRFGHQMSLVAGIDRSRGDAAIMMDCDLQHPPEIIPALLAAFEEGYDIVQTIRQYDSRATFWKRWTSQLFYRLQNALSPVEIAEGAADFRLISRKVAQLFQTSIREQNQFLRGLFQWAGFRTAKVSFVSAPRHTGRTKYRPGRLLTFSIIGITSFSKLPLRFAIVAGFVISLLSVLYGIWMIGIYLWAGHLPPGYTSLIVVVLFVGGLQLTVLGIIGEYLGSVFDEVKNRPLYVIDQEVQGAFHEADSMSDLRRGLL